MLLMGMPEVFVDDDGVRLDNLHKTSHQRAFDLKLLDNDLDDPIGIADALQSCLRYCQYLILLQIIGAV